MATPRIVARRIVSAAAAIGIVAVLHEFGVKYAEQMGWYDNLPARLEAGMTWLASLAEPLWFKIATTFVVGAALGLWADALLRRKERPAPSKSAELSRERIVSVGQRCAEVSKAILREHTRATQARVDSTARSGLGGIADIGFANALKAQSDGIALANEFGSNALAAIASLRALNIPIPDFTTHEPVMQLRRAIEHVVTFYLVDVAQYLGAMAVPLQDGDLEGARGMSSRWAAPRADELIETQGRLSLPPSVSPSIVKDVRLSRARDATSRWWVNFTVVSKMPELQICLDLRYFSKSEQGGPKHWGKRVRLPIETKINLVSGQTMSIQFATDGAMPFEKQAPYWLVPAAQLSEGQAIPALADFVRGAIVFIAGGEPQEHRFIVLPREANQALVIVGEESLAQELFWGEQYVPISRHTAQGARSVPSAQRR